MATVLIEGVFMGSQIKETEFEGNKKSALYIDIYQPDSESQDKMVQLKSDDIQLANDLNKNYAMGDKVKAHASVNAYKNKAYYKLRVLQPAK